MQMSDSEHVSKLVSETVLLLCKNSIHFNIDLKIQGLIAVTSDSNKIYIIEISDVLENASELETGREVYKEPARVPVRRRHVMPLGSPPNKMMALMAPNAASKRSVRRYSKSLSGQEHLETESVIPLLASQHKNSVTQNCLVTPRPMLALPAPSGSVATGVSLARPRPPKNRVRQPNISSADHVTMPVMHAPVARRMKMMVHQGRYGAQVRMPTPMKQPNMIRAKSRAGCLSKSAGFRTSNLRAARSQEIRKFAKSHMSAGPIVMPSPSMVLSPPLNAGGRMQQSAIALRSPGNQPLRMPLRMSMSVQSLSPRAGGPIAPRMLLSKPAGNEIRLATSPQIAKVVPSLAMVSSHLEAPLSQSSIVPVVTRKESQNVMQLPKPMTSPHFSLVQQPAIMATPRIVPLLEQTISSAPVHDTKIVQQKMLECSQSAGQIHAPYHNPLISPIGSGEKSQIAAPSQITVLSASGDKLNSPKNANQFPRLHYVLRPNQCGNIQLCRPPLASPNANFFMKLIGVLPQRCIEQPFFSQTQVLSSTMSSSVLGAYDSSKSSPTTLEAEIKSPYVVQKAVSYLSPATCASTIEASDPVNSQIRTVVISPSESIALSASLSESTMTGVKAPVHVTTSLYVQTVTTSPMSSALSKSVCFDQSKNPLRRQDMLVTAMNRAKLMQNCQKFAIQGCTLVQSGKSLQPPGRHVPIILGYTKNSQSAVNLQHCGDSPVSTIGQQKGGPVFLSPQNMIDSVGNDAEQGSLVQSQQNVQLVTPVQQGLQPILHSSQAVSHLMTIDLHQAQSSQPLNQHHIIAVPATREQVCFQQISQLKQNPQSGKSEMVETFPANEKERHSAIVIRTAPNQMPVASNSFIKLESETFATSPEQNPGILKLESETFATSPEQNARAQHQVLSKVCPVQQQTIAASQHFKILPTSQETLASSVRGDVTTAAAIANMIQNVDLDMPQLSPIVPINDNGDLSEVTVQISQSAQTNRADPCRPSELDKHHLEIPTHNLEASIPNNLVTQTDNSADVLFNTQLCKSQSDVSERENFLKPGSRSFILVGRSTSKLNFPEKQNVGALIGLPSSERDNRFDLDAFAVSQVEKLVKMRLEERLNIPEAERTSPNFQPPKPLNEQTTNEESFASESALPSIVWTSLEASDKSAPSPSSTIAYSNSPLRLSDSDLEEYEQNLADASNNSNQPDEENTYRLCCQRSGCSFAGFDAIELARHYTGSHTGDICVDAVISDQHYLLSFSAAELEISRDKAHDRLCPFPGCGHTFPSIEAVCSHHIKTHKTSLNKGQRVKIVENFGHMHRCAICQHGFATKACLIQHLKQHRKK